MVTSSHCWYVSSNLFSLTMHIWVFVMVLYLQTPPWYHTYNELATKQFFFMPVSALHFIKATLMEQWSNDTVLTVTSPLTVINVLMAEMCILVKESKWKKCHELEWRGKMVCLFYNWRASMLILQHMVDQRLQTFMNRVLAISIILDTRITISIIKFCK
jgi:hypothetical protein